MAVEREIKFLNQDLKVIRRRLSAIGAECMHPERLMRRTIFDFPDARLRAKNAWVRVRDEGDRITMSYKQLMAVGLEGMQEMELTVSDFETAKALLEGIGLVPRSGQESRRETWQWDNCEVALDTWPWLPSFIEIEGPTEKEMKTLALTIGLSWQEGIFGGIVEVFKYYYNVTSDEVNSAPEISFGPLPEWLRGKKK